MDHIVEDRHGGRAVLPVHDILLAYVANPSTKLGAVEFEHLVDRYMVEAATSEPVAPAPPPPREEPEPELRPVEQLKPAVPISKSVTQDYIVCLEDGKKMKTMRRYLRSRFQMTPEQYREKWGLPKEYPMVATAYAAVRRASAIRQGLGHRKSTRRATTARRKAG